MESHKPGRTLWLSAVVLLAACVVYSDALATMAVDMGSEYMKIAIVKAGVPMEIALNKESRRKTPIIVSMKDNERLFSDPAMSVAMRYPKKAYWYLQDLLGKSADNPMVKLYQKRFPYYDYGTDEETGALTFKIDDETSYTAEELMAMILEQAKETASNFAEQPIKEAVITVPAYFNQAERRAMLRAGQLAGLKVLQLMNDNTAVALNYGAFRRKSFTNQTVHYMFFDMGASSTTATVVAYQEVKTKSATTGIVETFPQLTIKGVGFDRTLGGIEFQLRLRDHLAKLFNAQKKTSDVTQNPRAMQKLFKEAGRLKQVLSANADHYAQVEGLLEDVDFRAKVTREDFENLCGDLFDRIEKVVKDALSSSEVTLGEIAEVILMGGATRVPKVQEKLKKAIKREELGKGINTDEAAALGAVYHSAHLSKGFKVLKFGIKDANLYPIQVEFERIRTNEDGTEDTKVVKRTLFGRMNPYPQKKVMTFNKHTKDFGFTVSYAELGFLSEEDLQIFGSTKLEEVKLSGIEDAHTKHTTDESEPKGVKAHFKMDDNGLLLLDKVEALFEKTAVVEVEVEKEESTLSKIGSTISNLFGGSDKKEDEGKVEEEKPEEGEGESKESSTDAEDKPEIKTEAKADENVKKPEPKEGKEEPAEEKEEVKEEEQKESDEKRGPSEEKEEPSEKKQDESEENKKEAPKEEEDEDKNEEKKEEEKEEEKTEEKEKKEEKEEKEETPKGKGKGSEKKQNKTEDDKDSKRGDKDKKDKKEKKKEPKQITIKEEIKSEANIVDLKEPTDEAMKASKKKLKDLRKKDEEKQKLEEVKNELESFIIDTNDKLYQEEYEKCSEEADREKITAAMSEASDWLYEQEEGTARSVYEDKLKELKKMMKGLTERVRELKERPQAIDALNSIMNYSVHFLKNMKNFTGEDQPFTEVEYETLEKLIKETEDWNKTTWKEQEETPLTERPKYQVEDVAYKIGALDREVKYLVNKAKTYRPKPKPKEKTNKTEEASNQTKTQDKEPFDIETEGIKIELDPTKKQTINLNMSDFMVKSNKDKKEGEEESTSSEEGEAKPSEEEESISPSEGESISPGAGDGESPDEGEQEGEQEEALQLDGAPAEDTGDAAKENKKIENTDEKKSTDEQGHDGGEL